MENCIYKKLKYVVKYPGDFQRGKEYPVIVFFAGAGSRGENLDAIRTNPFFIETESHQLPAVIFAPQCYANTWFDLFEQIIEFVEFVREQPYADKTRIYLIGSSMGAYAVWQLAMSKPEWFAAIVPICGGGMYWNARRLKNTKIWAFHGCDDPVVYCEESKHMVERINRNGGDAKLTLLKGVGHDSWINAYRSPEVFEWLLEQTLTVQTEEGDKYYNAKQYG